jgi:sarcosine oxidase
MNNEKKNSADVIVVGLGTMGCATAWRLAQRGLRVIGLEQFPLGHDIGSSHGGSRIIRQAYYEHPDYVPLVRRAWEGWLELEQATGEHLLTECPCLSIGPPGGELVEGVRRSAAEHGLEIEDLAPAEVIRKYPAFRLLGGVECVIERTAGVLAVERCVLAMAGEARRLGVDLRQERVVRWSAGEVETERGRYTADRVILTAGPWAGALVGGVPLSVMRQVVFWLRPSEPALFRRDRFPIFIADTPGGYFYGLPALDPSGVKVARHYGSSELASPEGVDREIHDSDEAPVRGFVREYLPAADGPRGDASTCIYTLTPDRHFVIGAHPSAAGVYLAAGFSGHGFKFAPVVGEILADLATVGRTAFSISLFAPGRW